MEIFESHTYIYLVMYALGHIGQLRFSSGNSNKGSRVENSNSVCSDIPGAYPIRNSVEDCALKV